MEKKKAIAKIVLISLLAVLLIVFSIISFMPAGSLNGFAGFAGAIEKGMDFETFYSFGNPTYAPLYEPSKAVSAACLPYHICGRL